jgi:hypothetical protein
VPVEHHLLGVHLLPADADAVNEGELMSLCHGAIVLKN